MSKRPDGTGAHERGKWFAPSSGGYRGLTPKGQIPARPGLPPKIPATAAGLRAQAEAQRAGRSS